MKNSNFSKKGEAWSVLGWFCPKRKWRQNGSNFFKISFFALSEGHARKIGLERLKAYVRREKEKNNSKKISMSKVVLKNGHRRFPLKPELQNNNIFFVKKPRLAFVESKQ